MNAWRAGAVAMVGFLAACATIPPEPVPVVGAVSSVAQLTGQ